jgi:hypothetical protein
MKNPLACVRQGRRSRKIWHGDAAPMLLLRRSRKNVSSPQLRRTKHL